MLGAALLAAAAAAVAVVAVLAARGRLPRNGLAGIRIPSVFASDDAWRRGHRAAVLPTVLAALICLGLVALALIDPALALLSTSAETAVLLMGVLSGTVLAGRAARRGEDPRSATHASGS